MLSVHRADRGAALVAGLAGVLAQPPDDPFTPDVVAVPARGVERWLAQQLSHTLGAGDHDRVCADGVCANIVFPRPDDLLDDAVAAASGEHAAAVDAWQPARVVWRLLDVLDACPAGEPWCAGLRSHLGLDGPQERRTRRWAVAHRLTGLFSGYAAARPELLRAWAAGEAGGVPDDLGWQPELWRRLREAVGTPSPAELLDDACAALRARPESVPLPRRLSVYGPSRLDAARRQVLDALAAHRDVHLWLHVASPVLWDRLRDAPRPVRRAEAEPLTRPRNPLLASLSRDVRELQLRLAPDVDRWHGDPPAAPVTLLHRLQSDLREDAVRSDRFVVPPGDRSVQVHACHGRARQVEVLREVVLGLLAADPSLEPRDVLVMCPDVEAFAPLVTAAFSAGNHPGSRLRVALADRSPRQVNPVLGVAAGLLELAASRGTAVQVLDLAGQPPVRRRFGLDDDALEQLRGWAVASGVRWGLAPHQRTPWQLAGLAQGTWRAGLDRVLTGVAVQEAPVEHSGRLLGGVLPLDAVDSSDVDLAGRLTELVDRAEAAVDALRGEHDVATWLDTLQTATLQLCDPGPDGAWQVAQLRRELGEVRDAARGSSAVLRLTDVTALLGERLRGRPTSTSFRTGSLTVCTLTPMRSVPHRVVCLVGLDDDAFPRHGLADGDDVLARDPHVGERDARSEDRQLLLDAVMAAGEHLVVTYAGSDVRTGAELAPAVPLGELLDALDRTAVRDGQPAGRAAVVRHPLQPHDARNFTPGCLGTDGPLSFDALALAGARAASGGRRPAPALVTGALPEPVREDDVDLGRLSWFLQHPARGFLRQRLDVAPGSREDEPLDALPVALDGLQAWAVGERVLAARLRGAAPDDVRAVEIARGEVPPGQLGVATLADIGRRVDRVAAAVAEWTGSPAQTVEAEVPLPGGRRLLGQVRGVRGEVLLHATYSTVKAKHRLRLWADLLALSAALPDLEVTGVLAGRGEKDRTALVLQGPVPSADAREQLAALVALRDAGLRVPLPLPVAAGEAYAAARARADTPPAKAFWSANRQWESGYDRDGEDADAEHVLVWGAHCPFDRLYCADLAVPEPGTGYERTEPTAFGRLARRLWQPLLDVERRTLR